MPGIRATHAWFPVSPLLSLALGAAVAAPLSAQSASPTAPAPSTTPSPGPNSPSPAAPGSAERLRDYPDPRGLHDPPLSAERHPAASPTLLLLSIDTAVRFALRSNPSLEQASAMIRRAQAAVAEARSYQLPHLNETNQFELQGPIPSFAFPMASTQPNEPAKLETIVLARTYQQTFDVSGSYNIDLFGRYRLNRKSAQQNVNVSKGNYYETQNELVYSVQNVYLAALRAQELIQVARDAMTDAQEQLRVAQAQLRAGTAPEFDVLRASVQVENDRQALITSQANLQRTLSNLAQILSLDPHVVPQLVHVTLPPAADDVAVVTAQEVLEPHAAPADRSLPASVEAALSEAFNNRPEIYRTQWARRVAETQVQYQRTGNKPSASLTAGYLYAPDAVGIGVETHMWSVIANLVVPIWDGGLTRARVREAQADVDSTRSQIRSAEDTVTQEVKQSLLDLEEAAARRKSAAANSAQAQEAVRVARVRYTAGVAANVEVTDAEAALTVARTNEVNAAYDYLGALAELNRSLGRYASDWVNRSR